MKGMKGKMMKKLKAANKQIGYLNPDRILQVSNFDGIVDNFRLKSTFVDKFPFKSNTTSHSSPPTNSKLQQPGNIHVEELIRDIGDKKQEQEDGDIDLQDDMNDKENLIPTLIEDSICTANETEKQTSCCTELKKAAFLKEIDVMSFRRPDMDSVSLFDPKLLAAFRYTVSLYIRECEAASIADQMKTRATKTKYPFFQPEEQAEPSPELGNEPDPLLEFNEKCPPGGADSVIFYTTSLRGIRKTFEDCQSIRFLLESFGVVFYERDVSIHSEYRDELWRIMGEKVLPPRLFIRGRYIGGADKVLTLHEQGKLRTLFRDIPIDFSDGPCSLCCGLRFMLCYTCDGSRKVFECDDDNDQQGSNDGLWTKCLQCNENGLVVCPLC
ncbi:uncharacterized protein LOC141639112 [Silene latifolia]|uniref:uncharacterized protein LOC141639112 n=1 Tax=Silene latifolia TaxID=37657 RepID=UPI003D772B67